jgi:hypothetical protein
VLLLTHVGNHSETLGPILGLLRIRPQMEE